MLRYSGKQPMSISASLIRKLIPVTTCKIEQTGYNIGMEPGDFLGHDSPTAHRPHLRKHFHTCGDSTWYTSQSVCVDTDSKM